MRDGPRKKISNTVYPAKWFLPGMCGHVAHVIYGGDSQHRRSLVVAINTARVRKKKKQTLQHPWRDN